MTVAVERGPNRSMAELRLDVLRVRPLSDQEAGVCVAQVVEPDAAKLRTTKHARPVPVSEVVWIDRLAVGAAEGEFALETAAGQHLELPWRNGIRRRWPAGISGP